MPASLNFISVINGKNISDVLIPLISITVVSGNISDPQSQTTEVLRYARSFNDVVSNGLTYTQGFFDIGAPTSGGDSIPSLSLTADLADINLTEKFRTALFRPIVTLSYVLASDPDTVEIGEFEFQAADIDFQDTTIQASLTYEPILQQTLPKDFITPTLFPGGF